MRPFIIPALMFSILVLFLSCDKDEGPDAFFINEIKFKKVQFMDLSKEGDGNIVRWEWDLGDGSTSTDKHPLHTYSKMDTSYSVRLSVTDENDLSDAITKEIAIPDTAVSPIVDFSYIQSAVIAVDSLEVTFTDESEAGDGGGDITSWIWDFGDTTTTTDTSTLQNPVHIYTPEPSDTGYVLYHYFTVSFTVIDEFGYPYELEQDSVKVNNPKLPTVEFGEEINILEVAFFIEYTTSDGEIISYHWDFGDNSTSTEQNPTHTFQCSGEHTITLEVFDSFGLNASNSTNIILFTIPPTAEFDYSKNFLEVTFTDSSVAGDGEINTWSWNFGDGNSSSEQHPLHEYAEEGTYTVSLIIADEYCANDTIEYSLTVSEQLLPPNANFTFEINCLFVSFTDQSIGGDGDIINWSWDFGDGNTSSEQNPEHTYSNAEIYYVSLTVIDENDSTSTMGNNIEVEPVGPTVSFNTSEDFLNVNFFDSSTGGSSQIISWSWDFGDGISSSEQNPEHTYTSADNFIISLTVTDECDLLNTFNDTITVNARPPTSQFLPPDINYLVVTFTDRSTAGDGDIIDWSWDFGDNADTSYTEFTEELTHNYSNAGTYLVNLIVKNNHELSDTTFQSISVEEYTQSGPSASFNSSRACLTVSYNDNSTAGDGDIISWSWDFGDGISSSEQNPEHTYSSQEVYDIRLIVTDSNSLSDTNSTQISVFPANPVANFTYEQTGQLSVQFADASTPGEGELTDWSWDFGDGNTSTNQHPLHEYSSEGIYFVNLTVTNSCDLSNTSLSFQIILGIDFTAFVNVSGDGNNQDLKFGFSPLSTDAGDASFCMDSQGNTLDYTSRTNCISGPFDSGEFGECPGCTIPPQETLNGCENNNCEWISIHTWVEGDAYAPPAPPPPAFDAALGWENDRYYTQILAGLYSDAGAEHVYDIALGYPGDNLITITWDNTGWSNLGTFVLQDAFGGAMVNVDMTIETSLELTNPAFNLLKLKVTPAGSARRSR